MRFLLLTLFSLLLLSAAARADTIGYQQYGQVAPTSSLTAISSGDVVGYFYGSAAGGTDWVRLLDVTTGSASPFLLNNHASTVGQAADFGRVNAGDTLVFELVDSVVETSRDGADWSQVGMIDPNDRANRYLLTSNPAYSVDGINHAFSASFAGDKSLGIPSGVYLGMEDLPLPYSDLDYNDTQFVFTNVTTAAPTPEPGSLLLMGTGVALLLLPTRRTRGPR